MRFLGWWRRLRLAVTVPRATPPRVYKATAYAVYGRQIVRPRLCGVSLVSPEKAQEVARQDDGCGSVLVVGTTYYTTTYPAGTVVPDEIDAPEEKTWHHAPTA